MSDKRVISIVGTGAVGGYYGALLQHAGHEVHFLLHSDFEHVKRHGLHIESCNGNVDLPRVHAYDNPEKMPDSEIIIIALKTTANAALARILPVLDHTESLVLTLQNGLGSEEQIAELVGEEKVLGGLCFLCASKIAPGHIRHLDYGLITLGEYNPAGTQGNITPRLKRLGYDLQQAGIPILLVDDLSHARWKKLVWNIPFNGLSVVCNAMTDELISNPATRERCRNLMLEVAAAAAACVQPIEPEFISKMMENTEKMRPYAPSMKLDYDRGNPMEIESIYGNPIRAARARGIPMPETEILYQELLAINPVA